jgi:hypothetical protein
MRVPAREQTFHNLHYTTTVLLPVQWVAANMFHMGSGHNGFLRGRPSCDDRTHAADMHGRAAQLA